MFGRRARSGRPRAERGAAALEFGLVSPIVFAVLFGTVTYGLWFNDSLNLRQGLREAARQGVVENFGDTASCDMDYGTSTPSDDIKKLMCSAQEQVGALSGDTYIKVTLPGGWVRGQEVVVCGMVKADRLPGLVPLPDDRMITWSARMSIEKATPEDVPGRAGGEEAAPVGADWSWCV